MFKHIFTVLSLNSILTNFPCLSLLASIVQHKKNLLQPVVSHMVIITMFCIAYEES